MQRRLAVITTSIVLALAAAPLRSQDSDPARVYALSERTTYQSGCFAPCLCPIMQRAPMQGTFRLTPTDDDGLFNTFALDKVSWAANVGASEFMINGVGTYKVGGDTLAMQQLELDLSIAGNPVQHFDSGLVPAGKTTLPAISVTVSMNHMFCHDIVLALDAAPASEAGIPTLQRWALLALGLMILLFTAGQSKHRHKKSRAESASNE